MINRDFKDTRDGIKGTYNYLLNNVDVCYKDQLKALIRNSLALGAYVKELSEEDYELFFEKQHPMDYLTK